MIDLRRCIDNYIENELVYDDILKEDKEYLESLTVEDKEQIFYELSNDEGIQEAIKEALDYYVWHTDKRIKEKEML